MVSGWSVCREGLLFLDFTVGVGFGIDAGSQVLA